MNGLQPPTGAESIGRKLQMTPAIIDAAEPLGISVHDHSIVDKEGHAC